VEDESSSVLRIQCLTVLRGAVLLAPSKVTRAPPVGNN
jgi:hypothetical protein